MRPRARARQLIRTRTHLRAAPGIFVLDERVVFVYAHVRARARAQVRTVGRVNNIRCTGRLTHLSSILFSLCANERTVIEPNMINKTKYDSEVSQGEVRALNVRGEREKENDDGISGAVNATGCTRRSRSRVRRARRDSRSRIRAFASHARQRFSTESPR